MASVFTYDPDPPRVSSPWSTPGATTPRQVPGNKGASRQDQSPKGLDSSDPSFLADCGITKLEAEPQDGPTEYKLHLLLRPRRSFISLSTGNATSGSCHSKSSSMTADSAQSPPELASRPAQASSNQSRQQRLQQLTTQLLWRLQQSSPFHSTSTADLVLPVLPDATVTLNVPNKPARLLPGLEESQGALYEIGVSDDGTFVGLTEDELEESLINLRAMAASLGCKVELMRKVAVGYGKWKDQEEKLHANKLWVAEALVSPDLRDYSPRNSIGDNGPMTGLNLQDSPQPAEGIDDGVPLTAQLHIAIVGPTAAGKSSLLGTLSTSSFDNGRGKSRLSLLKHRHEIASGITSSVAQELIGYYADDGRMSPRTPDVINYSSGNVSAWNDIHAAAEGGRLVFLSDLPGSTRYIKSTLRGLMSWEPHCLILCISADGNEEVNTPKQISEIDLALSYLELCIQLELPVVVVLTKVDVATRSGMRQTLARILSAIKLTGRKPIMLPVSGEAGDQVDLQRITATDKRDAESAIASMGRDGMSGIPIVISSAVTGASIGRLHALLRALPIPTKQASRPIPINSSRVAQHEAVKLFDITEVFQMPSFKVYSALADVKAKNERATILCGRVRRGTISVGDRLVVGPLLVDPRAEHESTHLTPRTKPLCSRSLPEELASFYLQSHQADKSERESHPQAHWQEVRVVSLRNLRLPVKALLEHQIGTIGVDPIEATLILGRVRKGMVLADFHPVSSSLSIPSPLLTPVFHTGFVASFPPSDYSSTLSSSLILSGNAIVYIASIRAAAKVTYVDQGKHRRKAQSTMESDIFDLDHHVDNFSTAGNGPNTAPGVIAKGVSNADEAEDTRITFSFVSSVEWIEIGSRVLATPGTTITMSSSSIQGTGGSSGLRGLVGEVCEVLSV
ncbi:hypothetical protein AJ80_08087 [Polytolypa hystricis UAMH7299]|uniref:Tr-type G domain-containing protein n=1 Tax=Polytolypa hystricis (strain UAMH7299) TaxID=1447883 RepID=A0A2B7X583_POLH7|nr:hypothetical protein AJ80_08087 [Polytolypa hystricis UAMH7299]